MLTPAQILAHTAEKGSQCLDGRDMSRLADFFPVSDGGALGLKLAEGAEYIAEPMTEAAVLARLRHDLDFAFEKALNRRGLSAGMMYEVVKMWLWVLEDDLQHMEDYAQYGLPLFKAVAVKYGFENPIGEATGSETEKYAQGAPWPD